MKGESVNNRGWVEATWKALYALIDLRDAGYGEYVVDGVKVKGINDGDDQQEEKTCKVNLCIAMPENGKYVPYIKPEEVIISDKKHDKGFTALGALQAKITLFEMTGDMVTSIYGFENKGQNGWMYIVNGVVPSEMPGKVSVKAGDKIIWYYSMSGMEGKAPTWEELTGQKPEEKPEEKPVKATIDPKLVEILPGESFTLSVTSEKLANILTYKSEIDGINNGFKPIVEGKITLDVSKDVKPGKYTIHDIELHQLNIPSKIPIYMIGQYINDSNKIATLPEVTVVVKEKENKCIKVNLAIEGYKGIILDEKDIEAKENETLEQIITRVLDSKKIAYENRNSYISMIAGQREIDRGKTSGWKFSINGTVPSAGINGVVPKKGDSIKFFFAKDAIAEVPYRDVDSIELDKKDLNLKVGEGLKLCVTIKPENATDKNVIWTSSDPKVVTVDNEGNVKAISIGNAVITASTEKIGKAEIKEVKCTIKVDGKEEIPSKDYTKEVEDSLKSTSSIILKANIGDWNAFALKAAGFQIPDTYLRSIEEKIKNRDKSLFNEKGKFSSTTDCERTIIGIVAAGGDPRNIGNYNLVEDLCSRDLLNENNIYALAYGIIALDSGKFSLTKNCKFTREDIVNEIVNMQTNGGWGFGTVDSDTTSICLIALSNYKNDEKTKKAINDAVKVLNNIRNDKGEYVSSWNKNGSSESISQAIIALTALGIDPTSKEFTKGEKNLMDCLLDYKTKDGGFAHIKDKLDTANPVATQQGLQALAAYKNFKSGKIGSIYNIKEFKDELKIEEIEIKNLTDVKEFKSGTDAKITVQAINNTKETKNVALIVGLFDKNDRLVNYAAAEQSLDEGKSVNLRVNLKLPKENGYTVKAFVWNGLDDMTPLSSSIEIPVK
ncbi:DUF4430 domain-containing protein [Clostridium tetanomorphum]|nr:DUF4430 domain-containing protein [Clostridium tetanomorphum]SQC01349.1 cell wall-binding protein [Clostridium tetanomorphum]